MYLTLFSDERVDGRHVGVRQGLQVEVSVGKFGRSGFLRYFVNMLKLNQLTLGYNSQACFKNRNIILLENFQVE